MIQFDKRTVRISCYLSFFFFKKRSVNVSICFNCLFLGFFSITIVCFLFPSEKKKKKKSKLFTFVLCVCFSKRLVRYMFSKKKRRKNKGDGIPCVFMLSNYLSTFSFCFSCELMLCSFFYAAVCFPYLFIKRLCARVYQLLLSAVCFIHFILFLFRLLNSLNLFTTKRKKNGFFLFVCFISRRLLCVFHYAFRWGFGWLCFSLYISVCMFVVCLSLPARKNKQQRKKFFFFLFGKKKQKNDKIDIIEFIVLMKLIFFTIITTSSFMG